jgi:hypothetical protein
VEQINEEHPLAHIFKQETNNITVTYDTFKVFSVLITYSEEVYTVSEAL